MVTYGENIIIKNQPDDETECKEDIIIKNQPDDETECKEDIDDETECKEDTDDETECKEDIIIEDLLDDEIDISGVDEYGIFVCENIEKYEGRNIIFRNCPNLKSIRANHLDLKGLKIENCPQVTSLSAHNNSIEELDLTDNKKLKTLICSHNCLRKLKIGHLKDLEILYCNNCWLENLDCSGLAKLRRLICSSNLFIDDEDNLLRLSELKLEGCESLEMLDCAENSLNELLLSNHNKLHTLLCKENRIKGLYIKDCPALAFLDFSLQGIFSENASTGRMYLMKTYNTNLYINKTDNVESIILPEESAIFNFEERRLKFEDFPKLELFARDNVSSNPAFEEYLDRRRESFNIIIEDRLDDEIDISGMDEYGRFVRENIEEYKGRNIIFRNCPNLKSIRANHLDLKGLKIENCPQVTSLSAYNNRIRKIDLSGLKNLEEVIICKNTTHKIVDNGNKEGGESRVVACDGLTDINLTGCENLQKLDISNNSIEELDLTDNKKLKTLICYRNRLRKLKIGHLKDLEILYCNNCLLENLDCSGLAKLKELICSNNIFYDNEINLSGLSELKLEGCESLEMLDCAENRFNRLSLFNHNKLHTLSCKENGIKDLCIKDCPALAFLDFSLQGIFSRNASTGGMYLMKSYNTNLYINKTDNVESIILPKRSVIFNFEKRRLWLKDFPKVYEFSREGICDNPAFEEYLDRRREEKFRRDELHQPDEIYELGDDDDCVPCLYKIPADKNIIRNHDLSHRHLTGILTIEDWPELRSLSVGNNQLTGLVVKNCPKLTRLIYSYNSMKREAEIYDCPNLDLEEIELEDHNQKRSHYKHSYGGGVKEWINEETLSEKEQTRIWQEKETEENSSTVYYFLQRVEEGERVDLDELNKLLKEIDPLLVKNEYRKQLLDLFNQRLEQEFPEDHRKKKELEQKKKEEQEQKDKTKRLYSNLLDEIWKLETNQKYRERRLAITKKEIANAIILSEEQKQELYQKLFKEEQKNTLTQNQQPSSTPNYLPWIIGEIGITIVVILGYLLSKIRNNKVK